MNSVRFRLLRQITTAASIVIYTLFFGLNHASLAQTYGVGMNQGGDRPNDFVPNANPTPGQSFNPSVKGNGGFGTPNATGTGTVELKTFVFDIPSEPAAIPKAGTIYITDTEYGGTPADLSSFPNVLGKTSSIDPATGIHSFQGVYLDHNSTYFAYHDTGFNFESSQSSGGNNYPAGEAFAANFGSPNFTDSITAGFPQPADHVFEATFQPAPSVFGIGSDIGGDRPGDFVPDAKPNPGQSFSPSERGSGGFGTPIATASGQAKLESFLFNIPSDRSAVPKNGTIYITDAEYTGTPADLPFSANVVGKTASIHPVTGVHSFDDLWLNFEGTYYAYYDTGFNFESSQSPGGINYSAGEAFAANFGNPSFIDSITAGFPQPADHVFQATFSVPEPRHGTLILLGCFSLFLVWRQTSFAKRSK